MNAPEEGLSLSRRLLVLGIVWLLAALAVQVFFEPEGLTVTDLNERQQRLQWLPCTPLFVLIGLASILGFNAPTCLLAGGCLVLFSIMTLACKERRHFAGMIIGYAVTLAAGVASYLLIFVKSNWGGGG